MATAGDNPEIRAASEEEYISDMPLCPPRRAVNILEFFMGTPDIITNVSFYCVFSNIIINPI